MPERRQYGRSEAVAQSVSVTFETSPDLEAKLDRLARSTHRSPSWHVEQALQAYLEAQAWQSEEIRQGLGDVAADRVVGHERVADWLGQWGTDREPEPPR